MDVFEVIIMKLKNGRKMYLKAGIGESCEWTLDRDEAIWFETEKEAKEFAQNYFKNFKDWLVESFFFNIQEYV